MEDKIEKLREYDRSLRSDIREITKTLMALGGDWNDDYQDVKSYYDVTYGQIQAMEKVFKILGSENCKNIDKPKFPEDRISNTPLI